MSSKILLILLVAIAASGCTDMMGNSSSDNPDNALLMASVSDGEITNDDPGEITLNAKNLDNETHEYNVVVTPVGDYNQLIKVTNREGQPRSNFNLGQAVGGATTGEQFAQIRKNANVTATVRVEVQLYYRGNDELLNRKVYELKTIEE